jgi:hypothetical protein
MLTAVMGNAAAFSPTRTILRRSATRAIEAADRRDWRVSQPLDENAMVGNGNLIERLLSLSRGRHRDGWRSGCRRGGTVIALATEG